MLFIKELFSIFDKKEKITVIFLFFAIVISALVEAIGIGLIFPFLNILGNEKFLEEHIFLQRCMNAIGIFNHEYFIFFLLLILILWYLSKNIYCYIVTKKQLSFALNLQKKYANKLYSYYMNKDYKYHLNNNSANLIRNIQSSVSSVCFTMLFSLLFLCTEIITSTIIICMLIYIDPVIAIGSIIFLSMIAFAFMIFIRKEISYRGSIQCEMSAEYIKWLNQGLNGIKEIKVLNKEKLFISKFTAAYSKYVDSLQYYQIVSQIPRFFIEGFVTISLLLLIFIKLVLGESSQNIISLLGVLALAAFRLMPSINRIVNLSTSIKYILPTFNLIKSDLLKANKSDFYNKKYEKIQYRNIINIDSIFYCYDEYRNVLNNVSLSIPKGKFVGIIGESGAGKTTFVDILLGLLRPQKGKITVDGKDILDNIHGWQYNLAYVPQNIYLIDGTIKENIALGVSVDEINDTLIEKVLKMSELYDFVNGLPDNIDTIVGEQGVRISGGQRQRIGIARALYNEPEVLILDEATSALDTETEKSITNTILKLKGQMTIIAIAHRLSTLEQCDFKVKFENGEAKII